MIRRLILFAFLTPLLCSGGSQPYAVDPQARSGFVKSCNYYVNRAKFMPRGERAEFVVILADSCTSAIESIASGGNAQRKAAAYYLTRLVELRDTVIDMNMERVFGRSYSPFTRITTGAEGKITTVRKVSAAGEYLIAHRMGLLDAYHAWLDTGAVIALASPPKG